MHSKQQILKVVVTSDSRPITRRLKEVIGGVKKRLAKGVEEVGHEEGYSLPIRLGCLGSFISSLAGSGAEPGIKMHLQLTTASERLSSRCFVDN